jgi:hypothetical protein
MAMTIVDILNNWYAQGVFSYVFPFLIIFATVFAILQKTKLFGDPTQQQVKGVNALIAVSIGLLSLLNDFVSTFFETLFPRFGVVLAIFVVVLILVGFFYKPDAEGKMPELKWIGFILAAVLVVWAVSQWTDVYNISLGGYGLTEFIEDYFWGILIMGGIGYLIVKMTK